MRTKQHISIQSYSSPCGELMLGSFEGKLCLCDWAAAKHRNAIDHRLQKNLKAGFRIERTEVITAAIEQLNEYFSHRRREFQIPLLFAGTEFQQTVWSALQEIPYGKTEAYNALAERIGMPSAIRAVANANGANALSIFVPCHRVIGSNHTLTGYAGGLDAKRFLLDLERR